MGLGLTPVELCLVLANNQQCFHPSAGIVCHPISRTVILGSSVSAYIHKGFHTPLKLFLPLGEFCFAPISTLAARHVDRTQSLVSDCWIRSLIIESSIIFPAVGASLPFEYGSRPYSGRALPCSCQQPTMLPSKCWDSLPPDISDCDSWLICERLHPQRIPTPLKLFLPLGEFCFAPISTLVARHVDRTQSLVSDCWIRSLIIESSIIFPAVGASLPFEYGSRPYSGRALPCSCQQPTMLPSKCWDSLPPDISDCDSWLICERLHPQRIPHTVETVSSSGRILLCSDINAGSPARRSDSIVSQRLLDTFSHHRKLHHFSCSRGISAV
ncbi:uncharacterized protein LOC110678822 isoform X2 [Aedes aegypti]|uniref:Uncharacterized protein n=1 Tax=Aedes aegypti TaxID=7159 RepID=A0A6I8U243_AEDAE|nr:uncharacterized protein LOC110678822 isoform X1 [Aedes aegypti]XP_021707944.1 uncharacterized protein LOC110678822 isoform X2 [Aedes aegypti]